MTARIDRRSLPSSLASATDPMLRSGGARMYPAQDAAEVRRNPKAPPFAFGTFLRVAGEGLVAGRVAAQGIMTVRVAREGTMAGVVEVGEHRGRSSTADCGRALFSQDASRRNRRPK